MVQSILLIWLDRSIKEDSPDCQNTIEKLRRVINSIDIFTNEDECIQFLNEIKDDKACLIISGSLGQQILPRIHPMEKVDTIFIFCSNKEYHENWAKDWRKIKGVYTSIDSICRAMKTTVQQCEQDAISMSFVSYGSNTTLQKLDKLEPSFMYTLILKEILVTIEFDDRHMNEFISYCRNIFANNVNELEHTDELKRTYHDKTPIWWYTYECFLYPMMNRALRLMDVEAIINMGFFIKALHLQLNELYKQQFSERSKHKNMELYRGQRMMKTEFEKLQNIKGGLISFNNFLSTSRKSGVSLKFARSNVSNPDMIGVLFVMNVHPSQSMTPFASITDLSYYGEQEDEVLFSMNSIFRVQDIQLMNGEENIFRVGLTLTNDNDKDLHQLTDRIRQETFPTAEGWFRLGLALCKIGLASKAQQIYELLLEKEQPSRKAPIYDHLGIIKFEQGEYKQSIDFYKKSLELKRKLLPPYHLDIAMTYNNLSNAYSNIGEYDRALTYQEKSLMIKEKTLPANHPDLAMSYNNLGLTYSRMGIHAKALSFLEKALVIRQRTLPPNHPDLAMSYINLGTVCFHLQEFHKALEYQEKALAIQQQSLPRNHHSFASVYTNLGSIYENLCNPSKALACYEQAVNIAEQSLPSDHPHRLDSQKKLKNFKAKM